MEIAINICLIVSAISLVINVIIDTKEDWDFNNKWLNRAYNWSLIIFGTSFMSAIILGFINLIFL